MATTTTGTELVRSAVDAINRRDVATLRRIWAPDLRERFPTAECRSADDAAAYFEAAFAAMPDLRIDIVAMAEERDTVFMRWIMRGHHTGEAWSGIVPSGKEVVLEGIDHFVVRDGTLAEGFVVFDQVQFGRAVGLMPPDGSAGDRAMKAAFAARVKLAARLKR